MVQRSNGNWRSLVEKAEYQANRKTPPRFCPNFMYRSAFASGWALRAKTRKKTTHREAEGAESARSRHKSRFSCALKRRWLCFPVCFSGGVSARSTHPHTRTSKHRDTRTPRRQPECPKREQICCRRRLRLFVRRS